MAVKIYGFGKRNEEQLKEIEEREGWKFVDRDKEPFPNEIGKLVCLHVGSTTIHGEYRGANNRGLVVLLPHLAYEFIPLSEIENQKAIYRVYWENKRPRYINFHAIHGLSPVREEYIKKMIACGTVEKIQRALHKIKKANTQEPNQ